MSSIVKIAPSASIWYHFFCISKRFNKSLFLEMLILAEDELFLFLQFCCCYKERLILKTKWGGKNKTDQIFFNFNDEMWKHLFSFIKRTIQHLSVVMTTWNSQENELNEASPFAQFVIFLINHSLFAIFRLLLIFTLSLFMELFSCWCICNKWEVILVNGITPPGESLPGRLHPLDTLAICIQHSHTISYNILKFQDFPTRLIPITIVSVLCGEVTKTFGWGD